MSHFRNNLLNSTDTQEINWGHQNIAIIYSNYNTHIVDSLVESSISTLEEVGYEKNPIILQVPGAFEIPWAVKRLIRSNQDITGIITLGAVIRGDTPHFDYICSSVTNGIANISIETELPIVFGVLTVDTDEQAKERSSDTNNKGRESTLALIDLLAINQKLGGF